MFSERMYDYWSELVSDSQHDMNIKDAKQYERKKCSGFFPMWICSYKHSYEFKSYYDLAEHVNTEHMRKGHVLKKINQIKSVQNSFKVFFDNYCFQRFHCKYCTEMTRKREEIINHLLNDTLFYCSYCREHRNSRTGIHLHEKICLSRRRRHMNNIYLNVFHPHTL